MYGLQGTIWGSGVGGGIKECPFWTNIYSGQDNFCVCIAFYESSSLTVLMECRHTHCLYPITLMSITMQCKTTSVVHGYFYALIYYFEQLPVSSSWPLTVLCAMPPLTVMDIWYQVVPVRGTAVLLIMVVSPSMSLDTVATASVSWTSACITRQGITCLVTLCHTLRQWLLPFLV